VNYVRLKKVIKDTQRDQQLSTEVFLNELENNFLCSVKFYDRREEDLGERVRNFQKNGEEAESSEDLLEEIDKLEKFAAINCEALRKIAKKYDKAVNALEELENIRKSGLTKRGSVHYTSQLTVRATELKNARIKTTAPISPMLRGGSSFQLEAKNLGPSLQVDVKDQILSNQRMNNASVRLERFRVAIRGHALTNDDLVSPLLGASRESPRSPREPGEGMKLVFTKHANLRRSVGPRSSKKSQNPRSCTAIVHKLYIRVKKKVPIRTPIVFCTVNLLCILAWHHNLSPILTAQSYVTIVVTSMVLFKLMGGKTPPDGMMIFATLILQLCGILTMQEAWAGFSNDVVLSVAVLGVVALGIENTGSIESIFLYVLGTPQTTTGALARLLLPACTLNLAVSNTACMAILLPIVEKWADQIGRPKMLFFMPLSYCLLISGTVAIFSTSSNLVAQGLMIRQHLPMFTQFEIAPVAIACTITTICSILLVAPMLLGSNDDDHSETTHENNRGDDESPRSPHGVGARDSDCQGCTREEQKADDGSSTDVEENRKTKTMTRRQSQKNAQASLFITPQNGPPTSASPSKETKSIPLDGGGGAVPSHRYDDSPGHGSVRVGQSPRQLTPRSPRSPHASMTIHHTSGSRFARADKTIKRYLMSIQIISDNLNDMFLSECPFVSFFKHGIQDIIKIEHLGDEYSVESDYMVSKYDIFTVFIAQKAAVLVAKDTNLGILGRDSGELRNSFQSDSELGQRELVEVVLDCLNPLLDRTLINSGPTLKMYNGHVIASRPIAVTDRLAKIRSAVQRTREDYGVKRLEALQEFLVDEPQIRLAVGDALLLDVSEQFYEQYKNSHHFVAVRRVIMKAEGVETPQPHKLYYQIVSSIILALMVGLVSSNTLPLLPACMSAAFAMVLTKCMTLEEAIGAIKIRTVLTIVGAFGLGEAIKKTNVATVLATNLAALLSPLGEPGLLAAIYIVTVALGVVFHATAVVVLIFPIAVECAQALDVPIHRSVCMLMIGAGCQMLSPISYQTNLMAYTAGAYDFNDFFKVGAPVVLAIGFVSIPAAMMLIHDPVAPILMETVAYDTSLINFPRRFLG